MKDPKLSIVVIFYNMQREAERTLYTLSTVYQTGVAETDYEIIAIDNGSREPLDRERIRKFGSNFDYHFLDTNSKSPGEAVNLGAEVANGEFIAVIVDGARMVTPGTILASLNALEANTDPFVCSLAWHLGPEVQNLSMNDGYNQVVEDQLLESIDWRHNGYSLFDIATLAPSSRIKIPGHMPSECSWLAMRRTTFIELCGFDIRFQSPGGGLINHDFLNRVVAHPGIAPIIILSEANFHQIHGGVATNAPMEHHPFAGFQEEYKAIHGCNYESLASGPPQYVGELPTAAMKFFD